MDAQSRAFGRCGVAQDKLARLETQAEKAHHKLARLREGLEPELTDDAMGIRHWRPAQEIKRGMIAGGNRSQDQVAFHMPMTRAQRLASASGATSFHFKQTFINRVVTERMEDGRRNRPGAAKAHNAYIERETAVAVVAADVAPDVADAVIAASPTTDWAAEARHSADAATLPSESMAHVGTTKEKEREQYAHRLWGRPPGAAIDRSLLQQYLAPVGDHTPGNDAGSEAGLRLLSGFELVRRGREFGQLLQGNAQIPLGPGALTPDVRHPGTGARGAVGRAEAIAGPASSGHDRYIVRSNAVAIQPDGNRALITNIDADPEKRAEFWTLVEKQERAGGPDQMSCRFADRSDFWAGVVRHPDCPADLRRQYGQVDHAELVRFDITSGKKVRAFLCQQEGWIKNPRRKPGEAAAAFNPSAKPSLIFMTAGVGAPSIGSSVNCPTS